jgi:hypothetical protein
VRDTNSGVDAMIGEGARLDCGWAAEDGVRAMQIGSFVIAPSLLVLACSASREPAPELRSVAVHEPAAESPAGSAAIPRSSTATSRGADDAAGAGSAAIRGSASRDGACAEVGLGIDLRALPTDTSIAGIDSFVLGEGQDLRDAAPAGAPLRVYPISGWGTLRAQFDGATPAEALARCERTVAAYLPGAPRLPDASAAVSVTSACRACPAASGVTLPPLDVRCATDGDCDHVSVDLTEPYTCCASCSTTIGAASWAAAVRASWAADPNPERRPCYPLACPQGPSRSRCEAGRCVVAP